jgi:maltokinase
MNRTVSGCAIMLLVDDVTGIEPQSYGTDPALLDELRRAWPPPEPPADEDGFVPASVAGLRPAAALRLTDRLGVALASLDGTDTSRLSVAGLVRDAGSTWRVAVPSDGISAFVAGAPMASERPIDVDQTHRSVVVGERAIVKWFREIGPGPSRAAIVIAHLAAAGFERMPRPLGSLIWRSPAGVELTVAQGDEFLFDARDGWEWCVERVAAGDGGRTGRELGGLVADLHRALAGPSPVLPEPLSHAGPDEVDRWRGAAESTLDQALSLTHGDEGAELRRWDVSMRSALGAIAAANGVAIQPTHGDLHVGQVLEWSGGLAVIDFDGNPTLSDEANMLQQPRERDVAQMLSSIDHVGRVVARSGGGSAAAERWIGEARDAFLDAMGPLDERLLAAFEVEQECRELVYAARFLPRWRYAPMATLRARFGPD